MMTVSSELARFILSNFLGGEEVLFLPVCLVVYVFIYFVSLMSLTGVEKLHIGVFIWRHFIII